MKTEHESHRPSGAALFVIWIVLLATNLNAQSSIVHNGGFENGTEGWTLGNLGMWVNFPDPAEGSIYAEVRTFTYQDLATVPGQTYHLQFAMAGNFNWPAPITMQISWGNDLVATPTWNPAGHTINNLGWIYSDFELLATAPVTRLEFLNPGQINQSPMLDTVSVIPVPEPSPFALLVLGNLPIAYAFIFRRGKTVT